MIAPNDPHGAEATLPEKPDSANHFMVGKTTSGLMVVQRSVRGYHTKDQLLNLAVWIVALADTSPGHAEFNRLLKEIEK